MPQCPARQTVSAGGGGAVRGRPELAARAILDLAPAFPGQADPLADVAKRLLGAVEPIAGAEDRPLAIVEAAEQRPNLLDLAVVHQLLVGVVGERVGEQLTERAELAVDARDRLLHRQWDPLEREQLPDLRGAEPGISGELVAGRLVAVLL